MRKEAGSKKQGVRRWTWLVGCVVLAAGTAFGQGEGVERWPSRDRSKGIALVVTAEAEARPALEYALLPKPEETQKGNGAVKYLAGSAEMPESKEAEWDLINGGRRNAPLKELDETEAGFKAIVNGYNYPLRMLKEGGRMEDCDFEITTRWEGYKALLPSLGKFRAMTEVLALEIRFDIKRHDWTAAREKLDTGFALARHMGKGETIIETLVAVALASMMCQTLEDWVAEPGAPNLYWALSNLPAPFVTLQRAMAFEQANVYFTFPEMREFKQGHYSAEAWQGLLGRVDHFNAVYSSGDGDSFASMASRALRSPVGHAALGVMMYPQAKEFLMARGMTKEAVEKMPVAEALERYCVQSWEEESDEMFKWAGLPVKEATAGMEQAWRDMDKRAQAGEVNWLTQLFLPSMGKARVLAARLDRQIGALRVVEAVRAYAAEKGSLPASLGALKLPVPLDATTGEAFGWEVRDGKGILTSVSSEADPRGGLRYEITLRK